MIEGESLRREIELEAALTRPFFSRLHSHDLSWAPAPGSWNLGQLAAHLAVLPHWGLSILQLDRHDMASASGWMPPARIDLVAIEGDFETHIEQLLVALRGTDLESKWTFSRGSEVLVELPRASAIRHYVLGHLAHHRGQLALYLRLSGGPVPGSYGSSRDAAPSPVKHRIRIRNP